MVLVARYEDCFLSTFYILPYFSGESIEEEEGEDIYDDICSAEEPPQVSYRPQPTPPKEPEPIDEDMYDDVEQLAETVKAELKGITFMIQYNNKIIFY